MADLRASAPGLVLLVKRRRRTRASQRPNASVGLFLVALGVLRGTHLAPACPKARLHHIVMSIRFFAGTCQNQGHSPRRTSKALAARRSRGSCVANTTAVVAER